MERKKHIRNLDRIRQMSVEELAPLLVHESYEFDVDYDWENPIETYDAVYNSPSEVPSIITTMLLMIVYSG